jgi:hypothetical protein
MAVVEAKRLVLFATVVTLVVLAVAFWMVRWDQANKIATSVSALTGVAALGVALWATLRVTPEPAPRGKASGRWLKVTEHGRRLVVVLNDDGSLKEWDEDNDSDTWKGTWRTRPFGRLEIDIGGYTADLKSFGSGFRGSEVGPNGEVSTLTLKRQGV